jgi:hypothetical protein
VHIHLNPRVSGGFVFHVLEDKRIAPLVLKLKAADFEDTEIHEIVKSIMIVTLRDFDIDINDKINLAKEQSSRQRAR